MIQEHCRTTHNWKNPRGKGRYPKSRPDSLPPPPWRSGVACQRFFPRGSKACGWFEVIVDRPASRDSVRSISPTDSRTPLSRVQEDFKQLKDRTTTGADNEGSTEPNPWLRRVQWAAHFTDCDTALFRLTASLDPEVGWFTAEDLPARTGPQNLLPVACGVLDQVIREAQALCRLERVGSAVLFEIANKKVRLQPLVPCPLIPFWKVNP